MTRKKLTKKDLAVRAIQEKKKSMTDRQIGEQLGIEPCSVYRIRTHRRNPSALLVRVIELLGWM